MRVKRIVANIETENIAGARSFYQDVLGLDIVMDHGWMTTYGSSEQMRVQISFAEARRFRHAGARSVDRGRRCRRGTRSHEEGRLRDRIRSGRRAVGRQAFLVRDPFGKLVNILTH